MEMSDCSLRKAKSSPQQRAACSAHLSSGAAGSAHLSGGAAGSTHLPFNIERHGPEVKKVMVEKKCHLDLPSRGD